MDLVLAPENRLLLKRLEDGSAERSGPFQASFFPPPGVEPPQGADGRLFQLPPGLRLYAHQVRAVRRVLEECAGRALLADDVGLGKTIEAGTCLAAYRAHGLVRRALILCPAVLLRQWAGELRARFALEGLVARTPGDFRGDLVLASLDLAKRRDYAEVIRERPWDLVIIDEAHRLKNHRTANWQLVWGIETTYLLLLTATPVQNDLRELFNLVTLVRPGLFATRAEFRRTFQADRIRPRNVERLHALLRQVMLRTSRRSAEVAFPPRRVATQMVSLSGPERELYSACFALLGEARRNGRTRQQLLPLVAVVREATSSPEAARRTLLRMARTPGLPPATAARYREVAELAKGLPCRKAETLGELIAGRKGTQALVFTEFRATQDLLVATLKKLGVGAVKYHGGLSPADQAAAVEAFARGARVMVATEAGAEGHNLQFCHWLINYDLPWNPMRLEQRIGRLHRLGQEHPVEIVNLVTRDTLEAHVLAILGGKLELCETVLGELDLILEHGLERRLTDAVLAAGTARELEEGFARLAREIDERRASFRAMAGNIDVLAGVEPAEGGGDTAR